MRELLIITVISDMFEWWTSQKGECTNTASSALYEISQPNSCIDSLDLRRKWSPISFRYLKKKQEEEKVDLCLTVHHQCKI